MNQIMISIVLSSLIKSHQCSLLMGQDEKKAEFQAEILDLIDYMFSKETCVQVFSENTSFSLGVVRELYERKRMTLMQNPLTEEVNCKGILVAYEVLSLADLGPITARLHFGHSVLFVFSRDPHHTLHLLLHQEKEGELLFKDAEGLLFIGEPPARYTRRQPEISLQQLTNISGLWTSTNDKLLDFSGKSLSIGTFNCTLYSQLGPLDDRDYPGWIDGVEANILSEITRRLNLSWRTVVPTDFNKWGRLEGSGWDGGVLRLIHTLQADVAFCGLWVDLSMLQTGLEMSSQIGEQCLRFVVPRPQPEVTGWQNIFKPFQYQVWILTSIFFVVSTVFLYLFSVISSHWYTQHNEYKKIDNCLFEMITILITAGTQKELMGATRQLVFVFIVLSFLFNACFSSGLYSQLTMPKYTEKLDTVEQLVLHDYYWITSSFPDSTLMFDMEDPIEVAWSKRYVQSSGWDEVRSLYSLDSRMALIGQQIGSGFNLDEVYSADFLKNFEASSVCHMSKAYSFGFRKGSPYVRPFNRIISRVQAAGLTNKLINNYFDSMAPTMPFVYELLEFEKSHISHNKSLSLANVLGVFHLYFTGLMISLIVFIYELFINRIK